MGFISGRVGQAYCFSPCISPHRIENSLKNQNLAWGHTSEQMNKKSNNQQAFPDETSMSGKVQNYSKVINCNVLLQPRTTEMFLTVWLQKNAIQIPTLPSCQVYVNPRNTLCLLQIPPRWRRNSNCKGWLPPQHSYLTYTLVQKTHRHTPATFDWWGYLNPVPNVLLADTKHWWLRAGHSEEKRDRTFPVSWIWWAHQLWNTKISVERERIIDTCFQHCHSPPRNPQQHPNYK